MKFSSYTNRAYADLLLFFRVSCLLLLFRVSPLGSSIAAASLSKPSLLCRINRLFLEFDARLDPLQKDHGILDFHAKLFRKLGGADRVGARREQLGNLAALFFGIQLVFLHDRVKGLLVQFVLRHLKLAVADGLVFLPVGTLALGRAVPHFLAAGAPLGGGGVTLVAFGFVGCC